MEKRVDELLKEYRSTKSLRVEAELCRILYPSVCNSVRSKLGASGLHGHILDDAESYAMEAVLHCIRTFNGRGQFLEFLRKKAFRMTIDGLRSESGHRRSFTVTATEHPPEQVFISADDRNASARAEADGMLDGLRDDHRYVLERVFMDGVLRQDVAKEIGRDPSRITQICRDSVKWLRDREKIRKRRKHV